MATAPLVVTGSNGNASGVTGNLFEGLKFFLLRRIPTRAHFVQQIEANGGQVVLNEANATYVIADHLRKDAPGGSYSYTFIEKAIKDGQLPNPGDHATHPTAAPQTRDVASHRPSKSTRTPFTRDDDLVLWNWVQKEIAEGAKGVLGNDIYKKLEQANTRHTFQSWRDRYIKKLMQHPPAGAQVTVPANPPPSPPTDGDAEQVVEAGPSHDRREIIQKEKPVSRLDGGDDMSTERSPKAADFTRHDFDALFENADDIENLDEEQLDNAWKVWAEHNAHHTPGQWYWYWRNVVRPAFLETERSSGSANGGPIHKAELPIDNKRVSSSEALKMQIASPKKRKREASNSEDSIADGTHKRKAAATSEHPDEVSRSVEKSCKLSPEPDVVSSVDVHSDRHAMARSIAPSGLEEPHARPALDNLSPPNLRQPDRDLVGAEDRMKNVEQLTEDMPTEEGLITSEANRDADMQLDADASRAAYSAGDLLDHVVTSEANEAANLQLQHESKTPPMAEHQGDDEPITSTAPTAADEKLKGVHEPVDSIDMNIQRKSKRLLESSGRTGTAVRPRQSNRRESSKTSSSPRTFRRQKSSRTSSPNSPWTAAEDEALLEGLRRGWTASQIATQLDSSIVRSASAVRSRKAFLRNLHSDDPSLPQSDDSSKDQADYSTNNDRSNDVHDEAQVHDHNDAHMGMGNGDSLTEANLESQQAQHRPQVNRAIDLPEDQENEDQTEMLEYLQNLLGIKQEPRAIDATGGNDQNANDTTTNDPPSLSTQADSQDGDNLDQQEQVVYPSLSPKHITAEPLSSQWEIDEALEGNMMWPYSPEQGGHTRDHHELFQHDLAQSQRPQDRSDHAHAGRSPTGRLLSQLQSRLPANQSTDDELEFTRVMRTPSVVSNGNCDQDIDFGEDVSEDIELEGMLDLEIPSPPGGFDIESREPSPVHSPQRDEISQTRNGLNDEMPVHAPFRDVVEISSRESSSSYHSSEPEQPQMHEVREREVELQANAEDDEFQSQIDPAEANFEADEGSTPRQRHAIETQDILNAETQAFDLDMPLPPPSEPDFDEIDHFRNSSPPLFIQPDESVASNDEVEQDEDAFIDEMTLKDFDGRSIVRALQRTSGHQELARLVLLDQKLGRGLPKGIPQIWSEEEDRILMSTDATALRRLASVKGEEECDNRRLFLEG